MNRSTIDLWVGIFVAIGFGAILFLALKVGNLLTVDRSPGYRLEASFDKYFCCYVDDEVYIESSEGFKTVPFGQADRDRLQDAIRGAQKTLQIPEL